MFFNITKQKSRGVLQVIAAIFLLIAPSTIGEMPKETGVYLSATVFSLALLLRVNGTQKSELSISHFTYFVLGIYAVLTSFWANNREGNLIFIFAVFALIVFHSLARDYFAENTGENIKRRTLYFLSVSGVLCSVVNFCYWISKVVPVAGSTPLYKGIGTNDFLAIFLYFCILASFLLLKGNSKKRKIWLFLSAVGMIFVFVMAKSPVAWIFATIFSAIFIIKKFGNKWFVTASVLGTILFAVLSIACISKSEFAGAFPELFAHCKKHIFGLGGGFWNARETYMSFEYGKMPPVGLYHYLFATSGVLGVFLCAFLLVKSAILFARLKNITSVAGLLLCISLLILPFGENIAVIMLVIGLVSYNEQLAAMEIKINFKDEKIRKVSYVMLAVAAASLLLFLHSIIRVSADNAYSKKDYTSAYSLYKIAGTLNITDSESLRMSTVCLRNTGEITPLRDEAVMLIDKATARDKDNLQNLHEKALIYDACGEFELSAQQYRSAAQKAFNSDKYNLLLSKELFKIVKKYPKGSAETKRAYEELIGIAQKTNNLDCKKEINDIADEAFKYTKGEIVGEG